MVLTAAADGVDIPAAYVSHSFNQFIIADREGNLVTLDHGDGYPRSAVLSILAGNAGQEGLALFSAERIDIQSFPGENGDNTTGASLGGLVETTNGYVITYNYDGKGSGNTSAGRSVYFAYVDKNSFSVEVKPISSVGTMTPVLAPTGLDGGYILWNASNSTDTLYYAAYSDGSGKGEVGEVKTATASLSDCQPILYNGKIVWYTTNNTVPTFYQLDENGVTAATLGDGHQHQFSDVWSSDKSSHWHTCTHINAHSNAGCTGESDKAAHMWDGGVVTKAATYEKEGTMTYTCTVCKYARNESIPKLEHNSSGGGSSSGSSFVSNSSNSSSSYSINVPSRIIGGTVTVQPTSASEGAKVNITTKPNSGYEVGTITVTDKDSKQIILTDAGDSKYTFIMPRSNVDVNVEFVLIQTIPNTFNFTDVQFSAYYYDAVLWAVDQGITTGTSATTFSPNASCTRAQMVTFLWRAAGSPKVSGSNPFSDVQSGAYYYDAVMWAVEEGITTGTSASTFSPDATVTRAQTVTFLYRAAGSPEADGSSPFVDVASNAYYANAVQWAVEKNVTTGTSTTTFSPNDNCTRAQIVTFLYRDRAN